jgi:2-polyprenyl-3-methyl-5-hydroxy-6-metoxy-1,4-benzoquinol methylase
MTPILSEPFYISLEPIKMPDEPIELKEKRELMADWVSFFKNSNRTLFNQCLGNKRLIELIIENTPAQGKILEAGCGTAMLSLLLADSGYDVTAMDYTDEVLEYARKRCCLNSVKLDFVRGDIFDLSAYFKPYQFDVVCHSGVLEHFSDENIIKSLQEHNKVSKRVIFNVPNNRMKLTPDHFGDERLMSNKKWIALIREAGYHSVKVYGGYDLPLFTNFILPGALFKRRLSFWWKWMSKHSIFLCE